MASPATAMATPSPSATPTPADPAPSIAASPSTAPTTTTATGTADRADSDTVAAVPADAPPSFSQLTDPPERADTPHHEDDEILRAQQHALTVPVDELPDPPTAQAARVQSEPLPEGFTEEDARLSLQMQAIVTADCQVYFPSPFAVCGEIRNKYNAMGGPGSWLGLPKTEELQNPGATGYRSEFIHGSIYWSPTTGAHPVTPLYMTRWSEHGWEAGWMGYPTSDEIGHTGAEGSHQEFEGAAIYWHATALTLAVIGGEIRQEWNELGAENGPLGYPISDEIDTYGDWTQYGQRMNNMEFGALYFDFNTGITSNGQWVDTYEGNLPLAYGNTTVTNAEGDATAVPYSQSSCPPGTTGYPEGYEKYNCEVRYKDLGGTWWNIRRGAKGQFGRIKFEETHQVKKRWVELMMQGSFPYKLGDNIGDTRWAFAKDFVIGYRHNPGDHKIGLKIVVDTQGTHVINAEGVDIGDGEQFGLITAHCFIPQGEVKLQYCPPSLPSPYL